MRKILEAVSLASLAVLLWITYAALRGPERLPDRIPTHFDLSGHPNGWGSPGALWLLPIVAVAIYLAITITSRFPSAFHYPVRVTQENLPRLQAISLQMIAWLKAESLCFFAWIQWSILQSVQNGRFGISPFLMPAFLVVILGTVLGFIVVMIRAARPAGQSI
jgi:uncharacterized membrane protein